MVRKLAGLLAVVLAALVAAAPARAATGYELDASDPEVPLGGEAFPHGIAVDQVSRRIYVAVVTRDPMNGTPGDVARFESDLTPSGTFAAAGDPYYAGVAVNPLTQGFYAAQEVLHTPKGDFGTSKMDVFSVAGTFGSSFALGDNGTLPDLAADSTGNVYYPSAASGSVRVYDSSGALQEEVDCTGCDGGTFGEPVSVALDSGGDLYVVDLSPDRVVKLTDEGGDYVFDSVLQSGRGAAAVDVDPGTDDVFVGDLPDGSDYHIVAYDSSGVEFDDFGAGLFTDPEPQFGGPRIAAQIAADATSHRLYVGEVGKFYVFDRVEPSSPPSVTAEPPSPVGQIEATLKATVNANGHAVLECDFEYTGKADFEANGFVNATAEPCPEKPDGLDDTALSLSLSGLSPATSYVYRVSATSHPGSDSGAPVEFETLPELSPTVTPEGAASVGRTSATLRGRVNPRGGSVTDCHFELGPTAAYGEDLPCPTPPGPVSVDVAQSRGVSGLSAGSSYHYRLVVTSNAGTTEGADVAFTTDDPPSDSDDDSDTGAAPAPSPALAPLLPALAPVAPAQRPLRCRRGFRKQRVRGKVRCVKRCRRGFRQKRVRGKVRCLNRCRRGFRKVRVGRKATPRGKVVKCVKRKRARAIRRQRARAGRR